MRFSLLARRLYHQHISGPPLAAPNEVVRQLVAVQSQDYPGARWSVGQRVKDATAASVDEAFARGEILRTHVLRPTWHFVTPDDIRWLLALTGPRVHAINAYNYRALELDRALLARTVRLFERELRDDNVRTRQQLARLLAARGIPTDTRRLAYIVMHAELEGHICSGRPLGKQQSYALLAERAPNAKSLPRDEGLAELARRFFSGHGPATLKHFVWWSSLTVAEGKRALAAVARELARESIDGREFFSDPSAHPLPRRRAMTAYLIPEYDEVLTGYRDLGVPDLARTPRGWKDVFFRPVLIDDRRAGTWKRTIGRSTVTLETNLFGALDGQQTRALGAVAKRYGAFHGLPVEIL